MNRNLGYTNTSKIADSYVLCVVGIGMTAGRRESVCRIVSAGKRTVREHIAVKVVAYRVAIERNQTVVGIVCKAAIRRIGDVTCRVVGERLLRENNVAKILFGSLGYSSYAIISIAHFSGICKDLLNIKKQPHPKVRLKSLSFAKN